MSQQPIDPYGTRLPIKLDATSNGEFAPVPLPRLERRNPRMRQALRATLALVLALLAAATYAQTYPSRAVRIFVGYPAGGGMDGVARVLGDKLAVDLGQPVVVENRAGASASIAAAAAASAAPDGHTLYLGETGYLIFSTLSPTLPADPVKSFAPVAPVGVLPLVFVVSPGFPAKNVAELIAVLKASPGKHSYGSPGVGTVHHLAFEQFRRAAGLDVVHIPYKGGGPMVPDVMSGRLEIGVLSTTLAAGPAKADKLRVLAVTSAQRVGFATRMAAARRDARGLRRRAEHLPPRAGRHAGGDRGASQRRYAQGAGAPRSAAGLLQPGRVADARLARGAARADRLGAQALGRGREGGRRQRELALATRSRATSAARGTARTAASAPCPAGRSRGPLFPPGRGV